ncbi:sensor histidine kinase [Segetibacter koreensis]|uniref:sensor histidine kinase n=1 Tax=Segetibacter koreensis TaxID=398037 RepID=UPI00035FDC18|nr:sensor histidine kinase [Segetibacter koreensis]
MKLPFKLSRWVFIVLHITFWLLLFSLPFLLQMYSEKRAATTDKHQPGIAFYILKCLFWTAFFYINAYILFPRLFYKRDYGKYILSLIALLAGCLVLELGYFVLTDSLTHFHLRGFILFNTFPFLFILACSTAYKMFLDRAETERLASQKETEHLKTELAFLRSQISPHFMFNVLNGMVALARKKSDLVEPSLIKLSSIMRYMLYENDEEKVSLEKELEYLQSYIDLQKQRFGKSITVTTTIETIDKPYYIEPMLLIPFVENAFKHGTGLVHDAEIRICLRATNGLLHFSVANRYAEESTEIKDKTSGIGLNNVHRRLNLLYKNTHTLDIKKNDGFFIVSLKLNLI